MNQKPASASHDLLIVQRGEALPARVHEALQRKGFAFRITTDETSAFATLQEMVEPVLVVDCGIKPGVREYLKFFIERSDFHDYPLLVLGKDIDGLGDVLSGVFGLAVTVKLPCSPQDLLEAINYIDRVYRRERATPSARRHPSFELPETAAPTAGHPITAGEDEEEPAAVHQLYKQLPIPHLLFEQLRNYRLSERSIGGGTYPKLLREASLANEQLLPANPVLRTAAQTVLESAGRWGGLHLHRIIFLTRCLLEPLAFEVQFRDSVMAAACLWPYAFAGNKSLLRKSYINRGSAPLRKELCSLIKDSALQITMNLHCSTEAEIVAAMGRLIGREDVVNDNASSIGASAIMVADITDRLCFQNGSWNPRAAYTLITRIKSGRFRDAHPAVLCCLVKLLSESITEGPQDILLSREVRKDPDLKAKAEQNRTQEVNSHEQKVAISSLTPGMKLSRPLFAYDGREVLSGDLILDQDLIWRIWQLSALRPLNAPVVVLSEEEKE